MIESNGMYQGYTVEGSAELKLTKDKPEFKTLHQAPIQCMPIYECPRERCIHREIMHEVPHVIPINTRIINHHIYRHTYTPCYTCTEENEVCNITDGCNNIF